MGLDYSKYIQQFLAIGLTEREAKVYMTLLTRKMFTTAELQHSVSIARTKIYEILQRMVDRGICIEHRIGKKKYFEAVAPEIALERLYKDYRDSCEAELEKRQALVASLTQTFTPVFEENKDLVNPLDFIEILKDKESIHNQYTKGILSTKREMLTFNKGPYACDNPNTLNQQESEEENLLKRGAACRNIYQLSELQETQWLQDYVRSQISLGQKARVVNDLPIKMVIFDDEKVMFPLQKPNSSSGELTMIYIDHSQLAMAAKMLFNHIWEQAKDFSEIEAELLPVELK